MRTMKVYPARHPDTLAYWDLSCLKKLLSHNADISIVTSPRAYGKSYAAMQLVLEGIRSGENSVWERYNQIEVGAAIEAWRGFAPDLEESRFGKFGRRFRDPDTGGYVAIIPYSISQSLKGLDDVYKWEIKDEFIPDRYTNKTRLETEFADSMSARKSIKRSNATRSIYMANNINWINPYTIGWTIPAVDRGTLLKISDTFKIPLDDGSTASAKRTIVWENVAATPAIIRRVIQSDAVAAESESELMEYYQNATRQEYGRIGQCPDRSIQLERLQIMTGGYYMGYRGYEGQLYWTRIKPRAGIETYTSDPEYIDPERLQFRDPGLSKRVEGWFNNGRCVFDSPETLTMFQRWLFHNRKRL